MWRICICRNIDVMNLSLGGYSYCMICLPCMWHLRIYALEEPMKSWLWYCIKCLLCIFNYTGCPKLLYIPYLGQFLCLRLQHNLGNMVQIFPIIWEPWDSLTTYLTCRQTNHQKQTKIRKNNKSPIDVSPINLSPINRPFLAISQPRNCQNMETSGSRNSQNGWQILFHDCGKLRFRVVR